MNRKRHYAEAKRLMAKSVFTREAFEDHLRKSDGEFIAVPPIEPDPEPSILPSQGGEWCQPRSVAENMRSLRDSMLADTGYRPNPPLIINVTTGHHLWAGVSRFHPKGVAVTDIMMGDTIWRGVIRGRNAV